MFRSYLSRIFFSIDSKYQLIKTTTNVISIGVNIKPNPHSIPIPAIIQINAAVVTPTSLSSCFIITPPPRNPIPVTIVDITLLGSDILKRLAVMIEPTVNIQVPIEIKTIVLSPATLFFFSLSYPTISPHIVAISIFGSVSYRIINSWLNVIV